MIMVMMMMMMMIMMMMMMMVNRSKIDDADDNDVVPTFIEELSSGTFWHSEHALWKREFRNAPSELIQESKVNVLPGPGH